MQRLESQMLRDAEEREFTIDISTEPHALELAILTLAASNILPRIPEQLPPKEAARDILGLFLNIRELLLNGPGSR